MDFFPYLLIALSGAGIAWAGAPPLYRLVQQGRREGFPKLRSALQGLGSWLRRSGARRRRLIESALPALLDRLSGAVQAGNSLPQALERVALETPGPLGHELRRLQQELQLGVSLEEGLRRLADRLPPGEAAMFCAALSVAFQAGGNLSMTLSNIARSVRERQALDGKVRALTAQGKMQGWIVGLMPLILMGILYLIDPAMIEPLFKKPLGRVLLGVGALLEVAGLLAIRKIVTVRL